jgi:hypothetical protein
MSDLQQLTFTSKHTTNSKETPYFITQYRSAVANSVVDPDPLDLALLDPDPDPYWECGSGPRSRCKEIDQNLQINLISSFQNVHVPT